MTSPLDVRAARSLLEELHRLEREIVEAELVRRVDALDSAQEAVRRLAEIGTPDGVLDRAAEELGVSSRFERVLVSQVREGALVPRALWLADADARVALARLGERPLALEYPLIEAEVARRQHGEIVDVAASGPRTPAPLREAFGWESYVVAALSLRGATIGLLHASAPQPAGAVDLEVASIYADGLAGAFERAALRTTLGRHREALQAAVRWMGSQVGRDVEGNVPAPPSEPAGDALTPRELQVLGLLRSGQSTSSIARQLVIGESTVKFHVKNILRKLGASSRAEAVAKYLRAGG